MAALETVEEIIANAIQTQQAAEAQASALINEANGLASMLVVPVDPGNIQGVTLAAPESPPTAPTIDNPTIGNPEAPTGDLQALYSGNVAARRLAIKAEIGNLLPDYLDKYYPCDWIETMGSLCAQLTSIRQGSATGLKPAVEQAIFDRGRTRLDAQAIRDVDDVAASLSRRGWQVPPGVAFAAVQAASQQNAMRIAEFNRDTQIRQAELEQENVRFAISESRQLLLGVKQQALQYLGIFLTYLAEARADANSLKQSAIDAYDQLMRFYQAQIERERFFQQHREFSFNASGRQFQQAMQFHAAGVNDQSLRLRRNLAQFEAVMAKNRLAVDILTNRAALQSNTAMEGAKTVGQIASAALSSTNTMASLENITQE